MKRIYEVKIEENNTIQLPQLMVNHLLLKTGDIIKVEWEQEGIANKCFRIQEDNEETMFNEEFYCIPERIFQNCEIPIESIQIIQDNGNITITTSDRIISSLGKELIASLLEQNIDLSKLADDLTDCINETNYENSIQTT